jgi:hypothetical protein
MAIYRIPIRGNVSRHAGRVALVALALALALTLALAGSACADESWESWPELNVFYDLNPRLRTHLDASYSRGLESINKTFTLAGYLDLSLKPIRRKALHEEDWAGAKYLWARIGYNHIFDSDNGIHLPSEERGIVALYAKYPVPAEIWVEFRGRADLRWIKENYSTRYRARLKATRTFVVFDHAVSPYVSVEWYYDTRVDDWSRVRYQIGPEVTVSDLFRVEVYYARQEDDVPLESGLNAMGAVAKFYF